MSMKMSVHIIWVCPKQLKIVESKDSGSKPSGPISLDIAMLSLRYPHIVRYFFSEISSSPKWCDTPWFLVSHRHIYAIPRFATYRAIVRYPTKKNKHESVLRYYRCKYRAIWKVSLLGLYGVQETVLLVNRAFVPPKGGGFWRKRRKWRICVLY